MLFAKFVTILAMIYTNSVMGAKIQSVVQIHNGKTAMPHSHPWLVRLSSLFHNCAGSLIKVPDVEGESDMLLTAAHCLTVEILDGIELSHVCTEQEASGIFRVVVGDHAVNVTEEHEKVLKVVGGQCPKDWSRHTMIGDIALIKLKEPVKFNEHVQPIEMAGKDDELLPGTVCTVAGWGHTKYFINKEANKYSSSEPADVLQEIPATIADQAPCKKLYQFHDDKSMICIVPINSQHPLPGDSGGALVCKKDGKPTLYGIVSHGDWAPGSDVFDMEVFTRVSHYRDWIDESVANRNNS